MSQNDAVGLLQKMSNIYEKGAIKVVNAPYINKNPLDIAWYVWGISEISYTDLTNFCVSHPCSAAIVIKDERSTNTKYTFGDYLTNMEKGEPKLEVPSSLSEAVRRLSANANDLKQV